MAADHEVVAEITRGQFWLGLGSAGALGAALIKVVDKLWARITARNDNLQAELILLIKASADKDEKLTIALMQLEIAISARLDAILRALPKREGDMDGVSSGHVKIEAR